MICCRITFLVVTTNDKVVLVLFVGSRIGKGVAEFGRDANKVSKLTTVMCALTSQ